MMSMQEHYIYIVFSATPHRLGGFIRRVTKESFNHVCISLDADLSNMYGFARRYYCTPLYGGFVRETPDRYRLAGQLSHIRVYRLPVTEEQHRSLQQQFLQMHEESHRYLYNHLSAITSLFRRRVKVRDSYTCVEFCVQVLHDLGLALDPDQYYSIEQLMACLESDIVYTGPMQNTEAPDSTFFAQSPVPHPVVTTIRDIARLLPRIGT